MENFLIILLYWTLVAFAAAWIFFSYMGSFDRGLAEAIAAMSLTNATFLDKETPHLLLTFRAVLPLAGSLILTVLNCYSFTLMTGCMKSVSGVYQKCLFSEETSRLFSKITKTTLLVYFLVSIAGFILLLPVYSPADAFIHMSSALSTGGYIPDGLIPGNYAQVILILLMSVGVYMLLLTGRTVYAVNRHYRYNAELYTFSALLLLLMISIQKNLPLIQRLYYSFAVMTGTGFSSVLEIQLIPVNLLIIFLGIGGLSCTSSSGIKEFRILIVFKGTMHWIRKVFNSNDRNNPSTFKINSVSKVLNSEVIGHATAYSIVYLVISLIGIAVCILLGGNVWDRSVRFILSYMHFTFTGGLDSDDLVLLCIGMVLGRFAPLSLTYHLIKRYVKKVL